MLEKWGNFADEAMLEERAYVFNCCFLQNPLCEMMMRFNKEYEAIKNYIHDIYNKIQRLNPVIIYLGEQDVAQRITKVSKERDDNWLTDVIEYHTSQGYGKIHGLVGFDGYITCLEERQQIEYKILEELEIPRLILEEPYENWGETYRTIEEFLIG